MAVLTEYLRSRFKDSPEVVNAFASKNLKLVAVHQRRWRGHHLVERADVSVGGQDVSSVVTEPRWNLMPDEMKSKFQALERSVRELLKIYAEGGELPDETKDQDEAEMIAALVRGGTYLVDSGNLDRLSRAMDGLQREWRETADSYTTEDGYQQLRDMVKEKVGEDNFGLVEKLIPDRNKLTGKFGLMYYVVPVQFTVDSKSNTPEREAFVIGAVEMLIRGPRNRLVEALTGLNDQLGTRDATGTFVPRKLQATDGKVRGRSVRGATVTAARKALETFTSSCNYVDNELAAVVSAARNELPDDVAAATALAKKLNSKDDIAETLYTQLELVVSAATDESNMVEAVKASI